MEDGVCCNGSGFLDSSVPGFESTEPILRLSHIVKRISKNSFQKFSNARCKIDGTERRFPSFQLWNDDGDSPDSWTVSKKKDKLNINSNSWRAKGPSDLRKD